MNIFLDANIIIGDYELKKSDTILFLNNFSDAGFSCFIPEIVFNEVISNFKKQLCEKILSYNSSTNAINRQTNAGVLNLDEEFIDREVDKYKQNLSQTLSEYEIKVAPLPEIKHSTILNHLFQKKYPFDKKDSGYKDFLIFHTLLENINEYQKNILLISKDNDFGKEELHEDLKSINTSSFNIKLRKSLNELNENELYHTITAFNTELKSILGSFDDSSYCENYKQIVLDYINSIHIDVEPIFLNDYNDLILDDISQDEGINVFKTPTNIISVIPLNKETVIVTIIAEILVSYYFRTRKDAVLVFRNFEEKYDLDFIHGEEDSSIVVIKAHTRASIKVQSTPNGQTIHIVEVEILEEQLGPLVNESKEEWW